MYPLHHAVNGGQGASARAKTALSPASRVASQFPLTQIEFQGVDQCIAADRCDSNRKHVHRRPKQRIVSIALIDTRLCACIVQNPIHVALVTNVTWLSAKGEGDTQLQGTISAALRRSLTASSVTSASWPWPFIHGEE